MIIKLYKASFIVHYHCSILTRDYLLMHCNCKSWSPPHGSLNNLISFGHYMFWGGMYCHLFSCRGNGLSSSSSLQSFPQTLEMSGGRFFYGLWATHLKPTLQIGWCAQAVSRAVVFLSTSSLVSSKPAQALEQMPQLKKMSFLQGISNVVTSKPNRLQQQTIAKSSAPLSMLHTNREVLGKNLSELH